MSNPQPLSTLKFFVLRRVLLYQAKAHEINQVGVAEAAAILAKGDAEAKVNHGACWSYRARGFVLVRGQGEEFAAIARFWRPLSNCRCCSRLPNCKAYGLPNVTENPTVPFLTRSDW